MARLRRKNLMVDGDKVRALARRRGLSESAAVREAVDFALLAEEFDGAMRELSSLGGIEDVFGKLPSENEPEAAERGRAHH
jgi:hypothetical protein